MDFPRHLCMVYEGSPAKQLPKLAALILLELEANRRCLYLNSPAMVAGIRSYLAATGLDVAKEIEKGRLILTSDQSHLVNGRFDADRMLDQLAAAVDQAVDDGYQGLWASGDMTWEFGPEKDFDKLLQYEWHLEELFHKQTRLFGICQYHVDTLPTRAIQDGLSSHRGVFVNQTLSKLNPYFDSPELLRDGCPRWSQEELKGVFARLQQSRD